MAEISSEEFMKELEKASLYDAVTDFHTSIMFLKKILESVSVNRASIGTSIELLLLLNVHLSLYYQSYSDRQEQQLLWNNGESVRDSIVSYSDKLKEITKQILDLAEGDNFFEKYDLDKLIYILDTSLNPELQGMINITLINRSVLDHEYIHKNIKDIENYSKKLNKISSKFEEEVILKTKRFNTIQKLYENIETEKVYSNVYKSFTIKAVILESFFGIILFVGVIVALLIFEVFNLTELKIIPEWLKTLGYSSNKPNDLYSFVNLILLKILIASIFITLATFFLRRASSFRKIADQAHQTSLELQALPMFTSSMSEKVRQEVYRDLVPKYFGKTIDQSQNDKTADILQDQMKMSIDIAKATTEMVKSLKDVKPDPESKKDDSK